MLKNLLLFLFIGCSFTASAFQSDTSAYQLQRLKINDLLAERSTRFGLYDESLNARTGIFGFQTKADIRNSNEILRQIVLNDNNIFKELKILMDYKDQEVKQVMNAAGSTKERIDNYLFSIKKLQDQNERLKKEASDLEKDKDFAHYVILFLILLMIAAAYFFFSKLKTISIPK